MADVEQLYLAAILYYQMSHFRPFATFITVFHVMSLGPVEAQVA